MTRRLVTGPPRAGTLYVTELLRRCGRDAHHERVFTATGVFFGRWTGTEVSWLAAPYVSRPWMDGIPVTHLTRHPEPVFRSLLHNGFTDFEAWDGVSQWRHFTLAHTPEAYWPADSQERAVTVLEAWASMMEGVPPTHVEDLAAIAAVFDLDLAMVEAESAVLGREVHKWAPTPPVVTKEEVAMRLHRLADSWGYMRSPGESGPAPEWTRPEHSQPFG
jgi:hypothetical protein